MANGTIMPGPWFTGLDDNGNPLVGGKLYTFMAGTSVPLATYTDANLQVAHPNPAILDGGGRVSVFLLPTSYKFVLKTADDVTIRTQDNISATATNPSATVDVTATVAGETIAAGQVVYLSDGSGALIPGRWYLAHSDVAYASSLPLVGMAPFDIMSGASGPIRLIGRIDVTFPVAPGGTYWVGATPGSLSATAGTSVRIVGVADTANSLIIVPNPPPATSSGGTPYTYTYEIIDLTDGASVSVDCNTSKMDGTKFFRLTAEGDRTIPAPVNPQAGMRLVIMHLAKGGTRTLTLAGGTGGFRFGSDIPGLTPTPDGKLDYIGAAYNLPLSRWDVVGYRKGY